MYLYRWTSPPNRGDKTRFFDVVLLLKTMSTWNSDIFSMIQNLSETVVLPIAGMILTFVLCYELITMIIEKNNMAEFDTFNIYKWIFKTFVAVYILSNTFTIVMGVFELAQTVVNGSAGIINSNLDVSASAAVAGLKDQLEAMSVFELVGLWLEINIVSLCMTALSIVIFIIVFGRMIEIYLTVSIAPIPLSTMVNRDDEVCCKRVKTIITHNQWQPAHSQRFETVSPKGGDILSDGGLCRPLLLQTKGRKRRQPGKVRPPLPPTTPEGGAR